MEKNSIHSQLTNEDPRSGAFEIENRPEEPQQFVSDEEAAKAKFSNQIYNWFQWSMGQMEKLAPSMGNDANELTEALQEVVDQFTRKVEQADSLTQEQAVYDRVQQRQDDPYDPDYR